MPGASRVVGSTRRSTSRTTVFRLTPSSFAASLCVISSDSTSCFVALIGAAWRGLVRCARYQESDLNNRYPAEKRQVEKRNIGDGYVIVRPRRDRAGEARLAVPLDGGGGLYIPLEFQAGLFAPGLPEVWLEIKSAHHLRQVTGADESTFRDPVVQRVVIISGAFSSIPTGVRVPLATYARRAIAAAAGTRQEIESGAFAAGGRLDEWEKRVTFAEIARRPVGRPRLEETIDLEKVREVVRAGGRTPTKAVEDHFNVSRSTARRYRAAAGV
jgi:hypothetical protein